MAAGRVGSSRWEAATSFCSRAFIFSEVPASVKKGSLHMPPHHNAGMVPVGANHLLQRAQAAFLKLCLVLLADGVGAGGPVALLLGAACAPEAVLRPEQHALAVALLGEHRVVGVVGAPDEVHAAVLNELHIPGNTGVGDGVGPARVVLVDVGPVVL